MGFTKRPSVRKFTSIAAFLVLWGVLFIIVHLIHMRSFVVDVVFYETLKDVFISGALTALIYFFGLRKKLGLSGSELVLTALLGLSGGYIFAITIPTVIDRSLSAYILEKFVQRGGNLEEDALDKIFVKEFISESKLMEIRLQEALSSGTLVLEDGCVKLTPKGKSVAAFTAFYRRTFLPKKRLLLGRVTDELTEPFRNSPNAVDYLCENLEG